jgi:hypothetical protein
MDKVKSEVQSRQKDKVSLAALRKKLFYIFVINLTLSNEGNKEFYIHVIL